MELHAAYVAGIFDGEGTIGIYRALKPRWKYWSVKLSVVGIYKPTILALQRTLCMGSVGTQKRQSLERTPSRDYEPRLCRQGWRWMVCNRKDISRFIEMVLPYLMEKRKQARIVMDFLNGKLAGGKASRLCKKAKKFEFGGPERLTGIRGLKGEENPTSKLTIAAVETIRRHYDKGASVQTLSQKHGLGESHVRRLVRAEAWAQVPYRCSRPLLAPCQRGDNHPTAKLTSKDVRAIRRRLARGVVHRKIAAEFRISQTQISLIRSGKAWRKVK